MTQYLNKDDLVEWLINLKIEYEYDWNFAIDNDPITWCWALMNWTAWNDTY